LLTSILLSLVLFVLLAVLAGWEGVGLYVVLGFGWMAYLRFSGGSPWLVLDGVLWPTSVWLRFFEGRS